MDKSDLPTPTKTKSKRGKSVIKQLITTTNPKYQKSKSKDTNKKQEQHKTDLTKSFTKIDNASTMSQSKSKSSFFEETIEETITMDCIVPVDSKTNFIAPVTPPPPPVVNLQDIMEPRDTLPKSQNSPIIFLPNLKCDNFTSILKDVDNNTITTTDTKIATQNWDKSSENQISPEILSQKQSSKIIKNRPKDNIEMTLISIVTKLSEIQLTQEKLSEMVFLQESLQKVFLSKNLELTQTLNQCAEFSTSFNSLKQLFINWENILETSIVEQNTRLLNVENMVAQLNCQTILEKQKEEEQIRKFNHLDGILLEMKKDMIQSSCKVNACCSILREVVFKLADVITLLNICVMESSDEEEKETEEENEEVDEI